MRSSKYDAAALTRIVATSYSLAETIRRLGLKLSGGNYRQIAARIRLANLDTSHFGTRSTSARIAALDRTTLVSLSQEASSVAQVLVKLGLQPDGRPHRELVARLRDLAIDTSHFRGQAWARGQCWTTHPALAKARARLARSDADVFVENSSEVISRRLLRRLIALGWPYRCHICGIAEWQNQQLVLHVDHINGVHNDNRFSNLRFLCSLCRARHNEHYAGCVIMPGTGACSTVMQSLDPA